MPATLPYITNDVASEPLREELANIEAVMGEVPPLLRILANVPPFVGAMLALAGPVFASPHLSLDLKTLATLRVSEINDCNYCRGYYAELAEQVGLVGAKRAALNQVSGPIAPLFDARERIVLQLADEMTRDVRAAPETVAESRELLGVEATLEAMMTVGLFNLINRLARTSGLPLEAAGG